MTAIEQLNELHCKYAGESPEHDFWWWVALMGVNAVESELLELVESVKSDPCAYFSEAELRATGNWIG